MPSSLIASVCSSLTYKQGGLNLREFVRTRVSRVWVDTEAAVHYDVNFLRQRVMGYLLDN